MGKGKISWKEMSPGKRCAVATVAVLDGGLRIWALADLARRPSEQVKGFKVAWAIALSVVNSAGVLPAAYLALARRPE